MQTLYPITQEHTMTYTRQELFTKVATHLLTQNAKSLMPGTSADDGVCAYRGEKGLMCAVGCLIPDSLYQPTLEKKAVTALCIKDVLAEAGVDHGDNRLLYNLQYIHDCSRVNLWRERLNHLAKEDGLTMPEVP